MDTVTMSNNDSSSDLSFIDDNAELGTNANSVKPVGENRTLNHIGVGRGGNPLGEAQNSNNSTGAYSKHSKPIPRVSIPGDFEFIDDINASPVSYDDVPISLQGVDLDSEPPQKSGSSISSTPVIFNIPSIYLPSNLQYIDDENAPESRGRLLHRGNDTRCSLKVPRKQSTKRRLCRHHSDSETKAGGTLAKARHHRGRSRKVRRSISAIETKRDGYKPHVRRSVSDRSGMIMAGKHLLPPRCRPHSHYENGSSRCSSTRTLSTNVSISEIVAVEMGFKDIPGLTTKEARRRRIVCTVVVVTVTIVVICVLLLAVTLLLSPEVDALLRKENEEIYRSMAAGASTSSPTTEGAAVVANNSAPPSGNPG